MIVRGNRIILELGRIRFMGRRSDVIHGRLYNILGKKTVFDMTLHDSYVGRNIIDPDLYLGQDGLVIMKNFHPYYLCSKWGVECLYSCDNNDDYLYGKPVFLTEYQGELLLSWDEVVKYWMGVEMLRELVK